MKQKLLFSMGGIGIGLMLAAAFRDLASMWQVTAGIAFLVASIVLRYFFEK